MHFRSHAAVEKCLQHVPVIHGLLLTLILLMNMAISSVLPPTFLTKRIIRESIYWINYPAKLNWFQPFTKEENIITNRNLYWLYSVAHTSVMKLIFLYNPTLSLIFSTTVIRIIMGLWPWKFSCSWDFDGDVSWCFFSKGPQDWRNTIHSPINCSHRTTCAVSLHVRQ